MKRILCIIMVCILCFALAGCKKIYKGTDETGTHEEMIGKDAYPYVFYWPSVPSEYSFIDAEENELN